MHFKQNDKWQATVAWHVDYLKVSHKDGKEITKFDKWLSDINEEIKVKQEKVMSTFVWIWTTLKLDN